MTLALYSFIHDLIAVSNSAGVSYVPMISSSPSWYGPKPLSSCAVSGVLVCAVSRLLGTIDISFGHCGSGIDTEFLEPP